MPLPHAPPDHPPVKHGRIGVLLINLGSPDAPTQSAVKRYLGQFLSDRRVVELPPIAWQPILRGLILRTRPKRSAANYAKVWDRDANDSPLRVITAAQTAALAERLGDGVTVDFAMRYGQPAIEQKLWGLKMGGAERVLIAPLYPQYSAATTATALDTAFAALKQLRWMPAVRTLPPYHDAPAYLEALTASIRAGLAALDFTPERLVIAFHGTPKRTLDLGDPYHCHCRKTARLLSDRLDLPTEVAFQSRFGPAEWLKPYFDERLTALPGEGVKRIAVVSPGFSADCLETLEEIAMSGREEFLEAGGEAFAYVPCLNAGDIGMNMLETLIRRELAGWMTAD